MSSSSPPSSPPTIPPASPVELEPTKAAPVEAPAAAKTSESESSSATPPKLSLRGSAEHDVAKTKQDALIEAMSATGFHVSTPITAENWEEYFQSEEWDDDEWDSDDWLSYTLQEGDEAKKTREKKVSGAGEKKGKRRKVLGEDVQVGGEEMEGADVGGEKGIGL
ncbi:hypothetical protein RUND412_006238 [Rhizina undulata]